MPTIYRVSVFVWPTAMAMACVLACQSPAPAQTRSQQAIGQPVNPQQQPFRGGGSLPAEAAQKLQLGHVYESQRWQAKFHFEEQLQIPGSPVFSAARIVAIGPNSPLRFLGLQVGDVITRLDGTKVSAGKWPNQDGCYWMLPELERHFGVTKVRFIRRGTTVVEEPAIDVGPRCRPQPIPQALQP